MKKHKRKEKQDSIIIKNKAALAKKILKMKKGRAKSLHVITDFDRTLTKMAKGGHSVSTSYDPINNGLGPKFRKLSDDLRDKNIPVELQKKITQNEKHRRMNSWWNNYYLLAVKHGMKKSIITGAMDGMRIDFRDGSLEFLDQLSRAKIPLLILSAGVGDIINECLRKTGKLKSNIHVVSNFFKYDEAGRATGYSRPLIHTYNKNEGHVKSSDYKDQILKRKNVILIGDSLGDLDMAEGAGHDCIIKIGFYNHPHDKELIRRYKKGYDVLIINNGSMKFVNGLITQITAGDN